MSDDYKLERMMQLKDLGITQTYGIGGILARLWRTILLQKGYTEGTLENRMTAYIKRIRNNTIDPSLAKHFNRGNLRRAMAQRNMTWKKLITLLKVIDIQRIDLTLKITDSAGRSTIHQVFADIGTANVSQLQDDFNEIDVDDDDLKHKQTPQLTDTPESRGNESGTGVSH